MEYMYGYGLFMILIVAVIFLVPFIFFILTLQKALERCAPQIRTITPGAVWLLLIPLFNLVWMFIVVVRISETLGNEFRRRKLEREPSPGQAVGLASCALFLGGFIPFIGILARLAALVCWIIYWVKIAGYSAELAMPYAE
jgi:hypothetical protein